MIGRVFGWLVGGGVEKVFGLLVDAKIKLGEARSTADKANAQALVDVLDLELAAQREANQLRLATAGNLEVRILVFVAGFPPAAHFGLVCLDSAFPGLFPTWVVRKLPEPMDYWQSVIILSLFGYGAVSGIRNAATTILSRWGRY